jgi:hypothetical protein
MEQLHNCCSYNKHSSGRHNLCHYSANFTMSPTFLWVHTNICHFPHHWSFNINHKAKEHNFQFWCTSWSEEALKFLTILALIGYWDISSYLKQYASFGFPKEVYVMLPMYSSTLSSCGWAELEPNLSNTSLVCTDQLIWFNWPFKSIIAHVLDTVYLSASNRHW